MSDEKNWRFCVVGNIVKTHYDEEGIIRYGTKAFPGGTKVYINGKYHSESSKRIEVIGLNRFKRYECEYIPIDLIENCRVQTVFRKNIVGIMDWQEDLDGCPWWGRTADDRRDAKAFAEWMNSRRDNT